MVLHQVHIEGKTAELESAPPRNSPRTPGLGLDQRRSATLGHVERPAPVIFDLDDTLIESFQTYAWLHRRVASELGWPVPSRDALIPYARTWEETLAALWPGGDLDLFMRRYDALAEDHPYPAVDGVHAALAELHRREVPLYIVTKRTRRRLAVRLAQARIDPALFDGVFALEDQPAAKPDPACFTPVWDTLGARPRGAVYVGDRFEDRAAAEAAGIRFLAVLTGPEVSRGFPGDLPPQQVVPSAAHVPSKVRC